MSDHAEAHYDLGFAYAEMGLVDDAITELQLALQENPEYRHAHRAREVIAELRRRAPTAL